MLALYALNTGERVELSASADTGGFNAIELEKASRLLRDERTQQEFPIEPSVLDVVYQVQQHFSAEEIRVISGYRAPKNASQGNHGRGRAIDLVVPGASDSDVAAWARRLGFVGVGLYTSSSFCHLDVRPSSYSWVDPSGPGQKNREIPVHRDVARQSDAAAQKQGKRGVAAFVLPRRSIEPVWTKPTVEQETVATEKDEEHDTGDE